MRISLSLTIQPSIAYVNVISILLAIRFSAEQSAFSLSHRYRQVYAMEDVDMEANPKPDASSTWCVEDCDSHLLVTGTHHPSPELFHAPAMMGLGGAEWRENV